MTIIKQRKSGSRHWFLCLGLTVASLVLCLEMPRAVAAEQDDPVDIIQVRNPKKFRDSKISCQRIPIGVPDDYKPCIAQLPDGELLMTAFHQHRKEKGEILEQTLLFRSRDGGKTWAGPEKLDLLGREPYLTVTSDGTIFITGHLHSADVRNKHGYIHGYIHRSTDRGRTWESTRIDSTQLGSPGLDNHSSRNILELADGTLLLGVDARGSKRYFIWRSTDRGKTWDRTGECNPLGFQISRHGFFGGETWLWPTTSGKILAFVRVDSREFPIKAAKKITTGVDHNDREVLYGSTDQGKTFRYASDWGAYGQMYPSLLRLKDGRLLYSFTVRHLDRPLGVRAIVGIEKPDGIEFDLEHDVLLVENRTPSEQSFSGGGFGPTVQIADGTLLTSYSYRGKDGKTHLEVVRWRLPK